ncbi:hypothetical protein [Dyadobacter jejuensis]|uniref:hypothetical protein n=1 Tax=Dyadobacter jejuensis TaxID=1082580 RepID=UPI0011B23962|nr:hypothetical protein [Dyadobacter jejuensis]
MDPSNSLRPFGSAQGSPSNSLRLRSGIAFELPSTPLRGRLRTPLRDRFGLRLESPFDSAQGSPSGFL